MQAITAHLANRYGQMKPLALPASSRKLAPAEWIACPRPNARVGAESRGAGKRGGSGGRGPEPRLLLRRYARAHSQGRARACLPGHCMGWDRVQLGESQEKIDGQGKGSRPEAQLGSQLLAVNLQLLTHPQNKSGQGECGNKVLAKGVERGHEDHKTDAHLPRSPRVETPSQAPTPHPPRCKRRAWSQEQRGGVERTGSRRS